MPKLMRGMTEWEPETIKLKFDNYLVQSKLPQVPKTFGHVRKAAPPGGWGMLGNDINGDCVMAGACHEVMTWAWATEQTIPSFTTANVLKQYFELTGGKDTGLNPIATAKWRVSTGLTDANGGVHTVKAFGAIGSRSDLELAVYLYGVAGIGLAPPDSFEQQFIDGRPWDDLSSAPNTENGHYVPCVGKNSQGNLMVVTWGKLQAMTPDYFDKYAVGAIVFFSREYLLATGKSPEAFDEAQLDADLTALQA
jgi:hypothetical protein